MSSFLYICKKEEKYFEKFLYTIPFFEKVWYTIINIYYANTRMSALCRRHKEGDRLFSKLFSRSKPGTSAYRRRMAKELHGLAVKYVTERREGNDDVIGRGGALALHGDEFLVYSSGDILLRADPALMDASYLMSGDGVVITAPDKLRDGAVRTVIVHFVYHRR